MAEQAALTKALHEHRLVTVVGPGGVGKTRLALSVAAEANDRFANGVLITTTWGPPTPLVASSFSTAPAAPRSIGRLSAMDLTDDHENSGTGEGSGNSSEPVAAGPEAGATPASGGAPPTAEDTSRNRHEVKIALIAGTAGVAAALIGGMASVLTGLIQVSAGDSANAAPPPAAPAVTAPTQKSSSAASATSWSPTPPPATPSQTASPSTTAAPHPPAYITDLNRKGDNWSQGTWGLGGKRYTHSLAWTDPCNNDDSESVTIELAGAYQHFTATVGVDDSGNGDRYADAGFEVYADMDGDGTGEVDELVASSGAVQGQPGHIDAAINGAPRIFLVIKASTGDCLLDPAVWGDARVS